MSTRESFLISPIKSIQRGSVTATTNSSGTITVTSVDTSKSVLFTSTKNGQGTFSSSLTQHGTNGAAELTNSTTVTWYGGHVSLTASSITDSVIYWQLVEYK